MQNVQVINVNSPTKFTSKVVFPKLEKLYLYSDKQPNIDIDIDNCPKLERVETNK